MSDVRYISALVISIVIHAAVLGCLTLPEFENIIPETMNVRLVQPIAMVEYEIDPVPSPVIETPDLPVEEVISVEVESGIPSLDENDSEEQTGDVYTEPTPVSEGHENGEDGFADEIDTEIESIPVESTGPGDELIEEPGPDLDLILDEYRRVVRSAIMAHRIYPAIARRLGREGETRVQFMVDSDGVVSGAEVVLSSGEGSLDSAALDAVGAASPVSPIPSELEVDTLTLSILVVFSLE